MFLHDVFLVIQVVKGGALRSMAQKILKDQRIDSPCHFNSLTLGTSVCVTPIFPSRPHRICHHVYLDSTARIYSMLERFRGNSHIFKSLNS
jgi:hypothetical protein